MGRETVWLVSLAEVELTLSLRFLNREQGSNCMLSEGAVVVESQVHLIVVRTNHLAAAIVTVGIFNRIEVAIVQIIKGRIITSGWCVEMLTRAVAMQHGIERIGSTKLVGLVCIDTLRIRELHLQSFQDLAPSEVVVDTTTDIDG